MNRSMSMLLIPALVILVAWQAPGVRQDVMSLVPQPGDGAGWQWDFEPEIYTPENLYEYINGEAEVYNDYEFMEMVTASHARRDDPMASVKFDIYDMGTPLNAFGIYSNYRRPELEFGDIGEQTVFIFQRDGIDGNRSGHGRRNSRGDPRSGVRGLLFFHHGVPFLAFRAPPHPFRDLMPAGLADENCF